MKILLTGSTQGIGEAIYNTLKIKHDITVINRRSCSDKEIICDLSDIEAVKQLCCRIASEEWDVLINNAGGSFPIKFECLSVEDIHRIMDLNFTAPVMLMQAVLPHMENKRFGRIINISSVTAKSPVPYLHIYSAAKSALNSLTQSLSLYYAEKNICINSICPGSVRTQSSIEGRQEISRLKNEESDLNNYQEEMIHTNGIGHLLEPTDIANFVEYLLSDGGNCIMGQTINICGNMELN